MKIILPFHRPAPSRLLMLGLTASLSILALTGCQQRSEGHGKMGDMSHADHGMSAPTSESDSASTRAFKAANQAMHADMAIPYSGDADADFVAGMIPHHQGAVAMAKIVLEHGKDPEIRKLAQDIVAAQDKEIAQMKAWQAKNAKP